MKTIITAIALATATPALAQDPCTGIGDLAETMMTHRQGGTAISELMPKLDGNEMFIKMLLGAYGEPRYSTEEYRQRSIDDFRSLWELGCYQAMTEQGT
jgi:hypothetical protein